MFLVLDISLKALNFCVYKVLGLFVCLDIEKSILHVLSLIIHHLPCAPPVEGSASRPRLLPGLNSEDTQSRWTTVGEE